MIDWVELRDRVAVDALRWAPKGAFTWGVGWLARRRVPVRLREPLYRRFAAQAGVDLGEVPAPLDTYISFDAFFTRELPDGARPVDPSDDVAVSPCDGVLSEVGRIDAGRLIQCKGQDYTVRGLLADEAEARAFLGGAYATIYLAPRNYHRVHSPTAGGVVGYRHIPGALFPVNPPSVRNVSGLFALNERLITYVEGPLGRIAVVMVAAMGVGHMTLTYDEFGTHDHAPSTGSLRTYPEPKPLSKAEQVGTFHLGSTVICLFQPGRVTVTGLERGRPVRMGEPLGRRASGRSGEVAA